MIILDCSSVDCELFPLYVDEELGSLIEGSAVVLPFGYKETHPKLESAAYLCRLKLPFGRCIQRVFLATLHGYCHGKVFYPVCEEIGLDEKGNGLESKDFGLLSAIHSFFQWAQRGFLNPSELGFQYSLIQNAGFSQLGEVGDLFLLRVRSVYRELSFYIELVHRESLVSSGTLRSLNVGAAIAAHWNGVLSSRPNGLIYRNRSLEQRLDRLQLLLGKCCTDSQGRKLRNDSQFWPLLFSFTAGWMFRIALIYRSLGSDSNSVLAATRSFELMLQAQALACGAAELTANGGEVYFDRRKISGCGLLVGLVEDRTIQSELTGKNKSEWVVRARTVLAVRNNSRLAHGILGVDEEGYNAYISEVKKLISEFAQNDLLIEFIDTFREFRAPVVIDVLKSELGALVKDYCY